MAVMTQGMVWLTQRHMCLLIVVLELNTKAVTTQYKSMAVTKHLVSSCETFVAALSSPFSVAMPVTLSTPRNSIKEAEPCAIHYSTILICIGLWGSSIP